MELSEAIKKVRLELCLSQEGLTRELHVGFTSVNRWENNHII
jgi:putative transcriptional regulator